MVIKINKKIASNILASDEPGGNRNRSIKINPSITYAKEPCRQ